MLHHFWACILSILDIYKSLKSYLSTLSVFLGSRSHIWQQLLCAIMYVHKIIWLIKMCKDFYRFFKGYRASWHAYYYVSQIIYIYKCRTCRSILKEMRFFQNRVWKMSFNSNQYIIHSRNKYKCVFQAVRENNAYCTYRFFNNGNGCYITSLQYK